MNFIKIFTIVVLATSMSGCLGSRGNYYQQPVEPLRPAPSGNVQTGNLQPISGAGQNQNLNQVQNQAQTQAQNQVQTATDQVQTASTSPQVVEPPAAPSNGQKLTKTAALGAWKASASGATCQLILSLTQNSDKSYRAAPLRCPNGLANVKAWNIEGNQLVLKDRSGTKLVGLNRVGNERYQGGVVTLHR